MQSIVDIVVHVEQNTDGEFAPIGQLDPPAAALGAAGIPVGSVSPPATRSATSSGDGQSSRRMETKREEVRRKMGLSAKPTDEPVAEARVSAILTMRSKFMTKLATGRNEARKILYQDLFFLFDKISEFESPEIAQEEGYAFLFNGEGAPCNVSPEETSPSYLWKFLWQRGPRLSELNNKHCRNVANFEKMQSGFPWLHVTLNYKRKVIGAPHGQEIFLDESFSFPLHKAAGDLIHACYKLPEFEEVLSSSALPLRAIHIHAVSLYAVLRKLSGYDLGELEESALGHLTWKYLSGGQNSEAGYGRNSRGAKGYVTAMYGAGVQSEALNEDKTSLLHRFRHHKFTISWADYRTEMAHRRLPVGSVRSHSAAFGAPSQLSLHEDEDSDWPQSAGAA